MTSKWRLTGIEVPIIGSDSVKWIEVSVSSSNCNGASSEAQAQPIALSADDCASCSLVGDPSLHLIWRIRKTFPHALELLHLSSSQPFPIVGLRINFPYELSPFAFISPSDHINNSSTNVYLLYVLSVSGIAFLLKILSNFSAYETSPIFPHQDLFELNLLNYGPIPITSVAATAGCLVVGRHDGSVAFFQLGTLHPTASGFVHELRDDSGISRLWGLMSRGRMAGAVQDLVIQEVQGKKLIYVLHSNGILRVWDLCCRSRIFSHTLSNPSSEGAQLMRFCVGDVNCGSSIIPLAILYRCNPEAGIEMIDVYGLRCSFGDKMMLSFESLVQNIPLEEGGCIDMKLTSDKIWILKDSGLVFHNLFHSDAPVEEVGCYTLQEEFIADQLFQSSEHSSDDLISITHSIVTSAKVSEQFGNPGRDPCLLLKLVVKKTNQRTLGEDHIVPFVSSIFLRRLLHPGVHHNIVLRATLVDYNRHWTDSEFQSLTVDGLKKEIISLIEHEGVAESPLSIFFGWKNFCTRYFHHWCKNNEPYGLFVHPSTGAVCLLRKNSVSVFRNLEKVELLIDGSSDELGDLVRFGLDFSDDDLECEVLSEVLRCIFGISQQLGKTASAIFYETLVGTPIISAEEVVPRLLKILETGYSSSVAALNISDIGADVAREKELLDHKNLRKFHIDMLLSLRAVGKKAASWDKVLSVIESYLQFIVPHKLIQNLGAEIVFNVSTSILVQATSQIAKVMFESALDVLLFVSYLVNISGQISMSHEDISKIQLELIPMIQEIVFEWLIILFFGTTPSESPAIEDFSSQLSSLQIDSSIGKRSWNEKLGKCDFTLAFILLLSNRNSCGDLSHISSRSFPNQQEVTSSVRGFTSWIIWGKTGEDSPSFVKHSTQLALILLKHGQYDAVEYLLTLVEANSRKEKIFRSIQDTGGDWCILQHILGCCLLAQAQSGLPRILKEKKIFEAVRCFFRASSGQGACQALQSLSHEAGLSQLGLSGCLSSATWKLHYYQWAMQIFEQYNVSEGSCQFALAALEQVDEALSPKDDCHDRNPLNETGTTIKGRLWANVFKFALDLNLLHDAYCAIISNPDEESKYICLRRFIIVLYERKATKFLCDGQLPFIGLAEKIEQELAWKAERSDVLTKPNPFKLLYAFEMQRHNWRRAASYICLYTTRLRTEPFAKDRQQNLFALQERLNGLSAAINALHLVHPAYAWIDPLLGQTSFQNENYPSKKAKKIVKEQVAGNDSHPQRLQSYIDIQKLEKEFVLTSAEYLLLMSNIKWTFHGIDKAPLDLVDLLVQTDFYDMAFTVLLKFCKGSGLKSELERVFSAMSLKCCPNKVGFTYIGTDGLFLTSSKDEVVHGSPDNIPSTKQYNAIGQWETLELYLEKYKGFHAGLPVVVAETVLRVGPQIELPLWLVHMFKDAQRDRTRGMTGQESSPASLFRLYVDYGRYTEATNLLREYIESFASMRPADIINRKRPFAVWFPYTTIERLWCQLEELIRLGHMVDQCDKLKKLLHEALLNHLKLQKVDSDDAISSASG